MKKVVFVLFIGFFSLSVQAQNLEKVKKTSEINWLGIDFTAAKMIGMSTDFSDPYAIVNKMFMAWNGLIIKEYKKYNLEKAFKKKIQNSISLSTEANKKVDPETLVTLDRNKLSEKEITKIAAQYKTGKDALGLVFAVENLDKIERKVRFYVVFLDQKTGKILYSKFIEGDQKSGFGFRNYWANGFYHGIKKIEKTYPNWE